MADVNELFDLGIEIQVRRVLKAMGEERIAQGLTAFVNGESSWANCFFARAYPELRLHTSRRPEQLVAAALKMGTNKVPMRIVYTMFDSVARGKGFTKEHLRKMIDRILDEQRSPDIADEIHKLLSSVDFSVVHETVWKDSVESDEVVHRD